MIEFCNEGPFIYASAIMGKADVGIDITSKVIDDHHFHCVDFVDLERPASRIGNLPKNERIKAKGTLRVRLAFSEIESIDTVIRALKIAKKEFKTRQALEPIVKRINESLKEELNGTEIKDLS